MSAEGLYNWKRLLTADWLDGRPWIAGFRYIARDEAHARYLIATMGEQTTERAYVGGMVLYLLDNAKRRADIRLEDEGERRFSAAVDLDNEAGRNAGMWEETKNMPGLVAALRKLCMEVEDYARTEQG